ncbi:MAG: GNAT family N-acetyltransferase [Betaproteobacteria bacterium]|nr:MAG: GNAT family N-acetyltransferase [Betaproteobacteria bacterium]
MTPQFTHDELRRIEEISQNASRPERGVMLDGWSVGLSPSKAKRSRCVNAFYPSVRPFETNLRETLALYQHVDLPCIFRLTPFVNDQTLDDRLAARGAPSFDRTAVQAMKLLPTFCLGNRNKNISIDVDIKTSTSPDAIGSIVQGLRGDTNDEITALVSRWKALPLALTSFTAVDRNSGARLAHVLTIRDGDVIGVFDVITSAAHRGRGLASRVLECALANAQVNGAQIAYLQVVESNPAKRVYERLGFRTVYHYWYRQLSDE